MEHGGEHLVKLNCHLHCQADNTTEVRTLVLPSLPSTVLDLKEKVQQEFSIPACIQTLSYHTEVLPDVTQLSRKHLRSGDTVDILYLTRGDCQSVEEVNSWLRSLTLAYAACELHEGSDQEIDQLIYDGLQSGLDSALGFDLFEWLIPRTMVNKVYFESSGGLSLLFKLCQSIFRRQWSALHVHQRYLESVCTQAFANFGETAALRRKLVKMGVLELCYKSQLRVLVPKNACVVDSESTDGNQEMNDSILKTELDNALHLLCCFSELPECQLSIASRRDVLKQIVNIALSPSYPCPTTSLTSEVLLCLAHTRGTHLYLSDDYVMAGMLQALKDRPSMVEGTPAGALQLVGLRCFTLLLMAILLLESPYTMPTAHLDAIKGHMTSFLEETQTERACQYEKDRGTIWATLLPYLKLAFLPDAPRQFPECSSLTDLQLLSLRVVLFFLHSKVTVEMYHVMLVKEGLLDFVLCLPWHVPHACRHKAAALTSDLCNTMHGVQPPRLYSLAQAVLAKTGLGLERVLRMSVGEVASYFYPQ